MGSILGNRVARVEDHQFLTVGGSPVEDVDLPGAAWLTYVRSSPVLLFPDVGTNCVMRFAAGAAG